MGISEVLFFAATVAWCQAMPQNLLWLYAVAVATTAIGKWWLA